MEKLYPPNIAGTLPAFYGESFTIPFSHNRAVSKSEIGGYTLKMKTIQSNKIVAIDVRGAEIADGQITFTFDEENRHQPFNIGQFYKVQIAYINNDGVEGYFSTVGVVKYTYEPTLLINNSYSGGVHAHTYNYVGSYTNEDPTEKLYSYRFLLKDDKGNLIVDSGEIIHDGREDENRVAICQFTINQELEQQLAYSLIFSTRSVNGLVKEMTYKIEQGNSINPELKADLIASLNYENGYVNLRLIGHKTLPNGKNNEPIEAAVTGTYKISRAENTDNYKTWNEVMRFALYGQQPSFWSWKDLTVKQGVTYKYSIQQYNSNGLISNRLESNAIYADFEHNFLYDGKRQLKIKFNPQVNSFKNDILESKIDTIGSQYPFIFRNGHIKYKEFPIGGLISALLDDECLFASSDFLSDHDQTIDLTSTNIATEREFKLEVLEWLNDGRPKMFRSPTEGNYIVRLLNVSLAPTTALGRMLHSFSATAYEIMEWNHSNLQNNNFLPLEDPALPQLRWETKDFSSATIDLSSNLLDYLATSIRLEGLIPGEKMQIGYYTDPNRPATTYKTYQFVIGATGSYILDLSLGFTITNLHFATPPARGSSQGVLTYSYYSKALNRFDTINAINNQIYPIEQFIGEHDILAEVQNVKTEIQNIYFIKGILRQPYPVYYKDGVRYIDSQFTIDLDDRNEKDDPYLIFKAYIKDNDGNFILDHYYDGFNGKQLTEEEYQPYMYLDNIPISLLEKQEYYLKNPKLFTSIKSGNGIMLEIAYRQQTVEYAIESEGKIDPQLKNNYINTEKVIRELIYKAVIGPGPSHAELNEALTAYYIARDKYMNAVEQALKEVEEEQGDTV